MMAFMLIIAALMIVVTTVIHAVFMIVALKLLQPYERNNWDTTILQRTWAVTLTVLLMFTATVLEASAWAATFLALGAITGIERALYFSMVTFSTLGYGDVVLDEGWRLLSSFEAANGIMMFGWTTAIAFAVMRSMYVSRWKNQQSEI